MGTTPEEREALIRELTAGADQYEALVQALPPVVLDFRPAPAKWSAREIVAHVADADQMIFARICYAVAEPGIAITPFNPEAWVARLRHAQQDLAPRLALMRAVRAVAATHLRALQPAEWELAISHAKFGAWSVEQILGHWVRHTAAHVAQIERNRAAAGA